MVTQNYRTITCETFRLPTQTLTLQTPDTAHDLSHIPISNRRYRYLEESNISNGVKWSLEGEHITAYHVNYGKKAGGIKIYPRPFIVMQQSYNRTKSYRVGKNEVAVKHQNMISY